jgi:chromosome segregation ATPase
MSDKTAAAEVLARLEYLERQLGKSNGAQVAARLAELDADLAELEAERPALYAKVDAWRGVFAGFRAEREAIRLREIEAQRAVVRDQAAYQNCKEGILRAQNERDTLQAQLAGEQEFWPIVRNKMHR